MQTPQLPTAAPVAPASIVRAKCPVCLGACTTADGVHELHRCRTCAGRGYVLTETEAT